MPPPSTLRRLDRETGTITADQLIDDQNGLEDWRKQCIEAVGEPAERIAEHPSVYAWDPLRLTVDVRGKHRGGGRQGVLPALRQLGQERGATRQLGGDHRVVQRGLHIPGSLPHHPE